MNGDRIQLRFQEWISNRSRLNLLRFGAVFAVTILVTAICVQVVERAYSETEDKVIPYPGEDYYVPYGSLSSIENETVYLDFQE